MSSRRKYIDYAASLIALLAMWVVASKTSLDKGLVAAGTVILFNAVIQSEWDKLKEAPITIVLIAWAIAHLVAIWIVDVPELKFGMVLFPVLYLDYLCIVWTIDAADRRVVKKQDSSEQQSPKALKKS